MNDELAAEMQAHGISIDVRAIVAYAENNVQVRTFQSMDKLIICSDKALLKDGATIAIVKEGGKPAIYIDSARKKAFEEAGVTFSDTLLKIAKII